MDGNQWNSVFGGDADSGMDQPEVPQKNAFSPDDDVDPFADPAYPFEEPEEAPELRAQRSASLYSRNTPFWERVVTIPKDGEEYPRDPGYWDHPEEIADERILYVDSGRPLDKIKRALGSGPLWITLGVLTVVLLVALLLYSSFATVKYISVEGTGNVPPDEVIRLSQLTKGMNLMAIDENVVARRIERNRYLRCKLVDVVGDTVVIHVRERVPAVSIQQNGRLATLDDRGWVLEVTNDLNAPTDGLITVHGLDVLHCALGQTVTVRMPARLKVYTQILIELKAMQARSMFVELDMTSMDSITLKTNDGFTILLGDGNQIHAKLRAALVVREVVMEKGYCGNQIGGTITVSDPTSPAFLPLGKQQEENQ